MIEHVHVSIVINYETPSRYNIFPSRYFNENRLFNVGRVFLKHHLFLTANTIIEQNCRELQSLNVWKTLHVKPITLKALNKTAPPDVIRVQHKTSHSTELL